MRHRDWQRRLAAVLAQHAALPWGWGTSDCGVLAADVGVALTGRDAMAGHRGAYSTEAGAAKVLLGLGYRDVADAFLATFPGQIAPAMAQRGDVGVVQHDGRRALAVCDGRDFLGKPPAGGLIRFPRSEILFAVRVD